MLKITLNREENIIEIEGDDEGLDNLIDYCSRIKGKTSPAGHIHLMRAMGDLTHDSMDAVICYRTTNKLL